ncbi:DUF6894 family protein [Sphingobium sp. CCH11-B1]|jgi:hypothetical protein|uniref:DUF6894 family protein n=1 Tax=Sphingobium sp. CCH11-B1 TaxID=1768781 RepID=UPI000835E61E|nr:hypothetical protein [Sphingobium sp. CCH11-B1]MEA3388422.1 hypothetical protein [Pseudomonadota bacterium]
MARYHINLFNDVDIMDEEGQEFVDLAAAHSEAMRSAREVIADHVMNGKPVDLRHRMEITDHAGKLLETIRFAQAISIVS